jgi:hypothetical protein
MTGQHAMWLLVGVAIGFFVVPMILQAVNKGS